MTSGKNTGKYVDTENTSLHFWNLWLFDDPCNNFSNTGAIVYFSDFQKVQFDKTNKCFPETGEKIEEYFIDGGLKEVPNITDFYAKTL